jgi:hypothetical protein
MDKTVQAYTRDALRLCGQMEKPGRGFAPEQLEETTNFLNQLLDSWNAMRNRIFTTTIAVYQLTANVQYYWMGPGATAGVVNGIQYGAFDTARPERITFAQLIYQTAPQELNVDMEIIDVAGQSQIRVPGIFSIPFELYFDAGYSQSEPTGVASLFFWPGPQSAYSFRMYSWQALNSTLNSDDTLFVPPGYARALTYNLAMELPGSYRKNLSSEDREQIKEIAQESRITIDSINAPCEQAVVDIPTSQRTGRSRFNWLSPLG